MPEQDSQKTPASKVAAALLRSAENDRNSGRSERRVLTALCYDLVGSTGLLEVLDIEDFQELMSAFQHAAQQAIRSNSGMVRTEAGDGGLALFPLHMDAKDAASHAIRAGLEIVAACKQVGHEKGRADLHVRIGIATSLILIQEGQDHAIPENVTGAALAMATRLQSLADPDSVLVSHETRSLVRRSHVFNLKGVYTIKGFSEPQHVWRAVRHKREVDRFFAFGRLSSPLVNRINELRVITECWEDARAGRGQVLLIKGEAGIGKSRLVHEIRRTSRRHRAKLLLFQCQPGGLRSTLHPMLQSFPSRLTDGGRRLTVSDIGELFGELGVTDTDAIGVFSFLLGAEGSDQILRDVQPDAIREQTNRALRQAITQICAAGPLILVAEDIHWIDPTSRQMLTELAKFVHEFGALLIVTARLETAVHWLESPNLKTITFRPLDSRDTRLAIKLRWPDGKSPELLDLVERVSGGVPLFIEEICQWTSENAHAATEVLSHRASQSHASVLESVIDARLEPMGPARDVVRAASVVGSRFDQKLIGELLPKVNETMIGIALDGLGRAGFLTQIRASAAPSFSFRHALIQETIYNSMLRNTRRGFHSKLFAVVSRNRDIAPWIGTATLAEHAERAGAVENAIELFIAAGIETSSRSAMVEARQLLEHALALCDQLAESGRQDVLQLTAMAALGPVLTGTEGPNSPPARQLYDDGVEIARRRPMAERARWFPIYWGWWFTGTTVNGERAHAVLDDFKDVEDAEVQLQARHCVWAIDFYLGHHGSCIAEVDAGLALYRGRHRPKDVTLFGGHDARVCGLAHRGLSLWFTGRPVQALQSLAEAKSSAQRDGHVGSIAHVYLNSAMLNCYRRDFSALRNDIADIRSLTKDNRLPSLAATSRILEGWCEGIEGNAARGREMVRQGLEIHGQLQTPEDYPVYCSLLAEIMMRTGEMEEGLELLAAAIAVGEQTGHRYWLAELHRRRAHLLCLRRADDNEVLGALKECLIIASEQNAVPILLTAFEALASSGLSSELTAHFGDRVERAKSAVKPGEEIFANPEKILMRESVR